MREFLLLVVVAATGIVAKIPSECPTDSRDVLKLPHESDCSQYYTCLMGRKFLTPCAVDQDNRKLCFDPESQICGTWEKCGCKDHLDPECSSVSDNHMWPDPSNNAAYYQCKNGRKVLCKCEKDSIFDQTKQSCQKKTPDMSCPLADSKDTVRYWHECDCRLYYECKNGKLIRQSCPPGMLFDHQILKCMQADQADCNKPHLPNGCPPNGITNIPDPTNCYQYYQCVNGKKNLQRCKEGMAFDQYKKMCVWWSSANCGERSTTRAPPSSCLNWPKPKKRDPNDCNRYFECVNGRIEPGKCLENHYFNEIVQACDLPKNTNCVPKNNNDDCPVPDCGKKRFPSDEGCEWYLECQNGKKILKKCAEGLQFNKNTQMCDLPENVNCNECKPGSQRHHECQCNMYYVCNQEKKWAWHKCDDGFEYDCYLNECTLPKGRCCKDEVLYGFSNATSAASFFGSY